MKYQISPAQSQSFDQNGFIVIEDFLDAMELEQWRHVTMEAVDERLASAAAGKSSGMTNLTNDDNYYSQVFLQCVRLADSHAGMKAIMTDEKLGQVAGTLAGVDGVRIWHDQALFKQAYGNPTSWHLDNPYWSFSSPHSISIWVALDDATLHNGCMWYLPGTHKLATYENVGIGSNMRDLFKVYPEWLKMTAVPVPAKAGSAVFHNGLTAHAAGANMTPGMRRAMTCAFMPDGSTFNGVQNILPKDMFDSYKIGDELDSSFNPLVWHK